MLKFNQSLLLNEAWQDLGMHNQDLVTVVEAVAWAQYKKYDEELYIQTVDYTDWEYVDVSKASLNPELIDLVKEISTTHEAIVYEHHVRIRKK